MHRIYSAEDRLLFNQFWTLETPEKFQAFVGLHFPDIVLPPPKIVIGYPHCRKREVTEAFPQTFVWFPVHGILTFYVKQLEQNPLIQVDFFSYEGHKSWAKYITMEAIHVQLKKIVQLMAVPDPLLIHREF